jgi:hypothetical protein
MYDSRLKARKWIHSTVTMVCEAVKSCKFFCTFRMNVLSPSSEFKNNSTLRKYCHVYGVTIDGVWIGDSIYWPLIQSRLVTTLYRSLTHTDWCHESIIVSTSRFLATDFNTGTVKVSLNYTLQISHIKSSLHSRTLN